MRGSRLLVIATAIAIGACSQSNPASHAGTMGSQSAIPPNGAAPLAAGAVVGAPGQGSGITPAAPGIDNNPGGGNAGTTSVNGAAPAPVTGSGGAAAPSTAGGAPATADPPGTVTLTMGSFMLQGGQEIYKCQNFDNPFGGKDAAVQRIVTDMAPGSHHLHVYHMTTSATRTLEDCTIADFHPLMHAAATPHAETTYPAGMAVKLLGSSGLRIQVHYLNTTSDTKMVQASLKLSPVDATTITKWVSELYFSRAMLQVPPGMNQTVTTSCTVPATYGPIGLVSGGTHMHMRGIKFVAKSSTGAMLADVNTWDEPPPIVYDPPVMLNPGDSISWTCTYNNDTGQTLVFGDSAEKNEMCIYLARFFSAPDGAQLECQAQTSTGTPFTRTM